MFDQSLSSFRSTSYMSKPIQPTLFPNINVKLFCNTISDYHITEIRAYNWDTFTVVEGRQR